MKNIFYFLSLLIFIGTTSCSNDDGGNTQETPKSNSKAITSFGFNAAANDELDANITATINENDKTITAAVPYGTDITSLVPTIEVSPKATFTPAGTQDFSSQVTYTVTAEDGSEIDYTVTVIITPNNEAKILSFVFFAENNPALEADISATIDENTKTITAEVPYGTDITGLTPALDVSPGADFTSKGVQDFSSEVIYTVTADDETTEVNYTVYVNESSNTDAKIIRFSFLAENNTVLEEDVTAIIDEDAKTVAVEIPYGTDIAQLTPTLEVSPGANFTPEGSQDFSSEVTYTVTAQDGTTTSEYTVIVDLVVSQRDILIAIYNANPGNTLGWDLNDADISNWNGATIDEDGYIIYLYLTDKNLTNIPSEIGQLVRLEELSFANNQLTSIPAEIGNLSNLIYVDLTLNNLTSIPAEIGQLANLESLVINFNQLTSIPDEIGQLANLKSLVLASNQLTSLPTQIAQLSNLEGLNINANLFSSIPAQIWELSNLRSLDLSTNQLTSIPAEIEQLINLRSLSLRSNQLTSLPTEIDQLVNLENLYIDANNFTSVPSEIWQFTNLKFLDLSTNQLTSIPEEIGQLSNLEFLDLGRNELTSIPNVIGQLVNLDRLDLANNNLTTIPVEIGQLVNLYRLLLNNNNLTTIPQEVCDLYTTYGTEIVTDEGVTCE